MNLGMPAIRRLYNRTPRLVENAIMENDSYVFFQEYDGGSWPAGSLGFPVTGERSIATDKNIYPRGGVVFVDTDAARFAGSPRRLSAVHARSGHRWRHTRSGALRLVFGRWPHGRDSWRVDNTPKATCITCS